LSARTTFSARIERSVRDNYPADRQCLFDQFVANGALDLGGLRNDTPLRVADLSREPGDELRVCHEKTTRPGHDGCLRNRSGSRRGIGAPPFALVITRPG